MSIHSALKLLVIDQDSLAGNFLKQVLNPDDYHIFNVSSFSDAISTTHTSHPDVIVIYIMQASSNGWNLCREIQEQSQAPILVLAGISDPNSIAQWLDAGADDLLTRPFSSEVLVAHIQKLIRRSKHNNNPAPRQPDNSGRD